MSTSIEIPLDDNDRLADPPLLDLFHEEGDGYVATFVPSDDVSPEPTLSVVISKQSFEGRRISILLERIETLCASRIAMASHPGGWNYTLRLIDGRTITLAAIDNAAAVEVFDRLKQIAVDAETSYRINHAHAPRWHSAV